MAEEFATPMDFAGMETLSFSQVCAVPPDTARSFVSNRC